MANAKSPFKRKLHIDGEEWSYRVGKWSVAIRSPDLSKTIVEFIGVFTGESHEEIMRARMKGGSAGAVTPGELKKYIQDRPAER